MIPDELRSALRKDNEYPRLLAQFGTDEKIIENFRLSHDLTPVIDRFKNALLNEEQFIATAEDMSNLKAFVGMLGINAENFEEIAERAAGAFTAQ